MGKRPKIAEWHGLRRPNQAAGQDNHHPKERRRGSSPNPQVMGRTNLSSRFDMNPAPFPYARRAHSTTPDRVIDWRRRTERFAANSTIFRVAFESLHVDDIRSGKTKSAARTLPRRGHERCQCEFSRPLNNPCWPSLQEQGFFARPMMSEYCVTREIDARRRPLDAGCPRPVKIRFPVRRPHQRS
jgi:hypothetical protein